jgi:hypothetical protein
MHQVISPLAAARLELSRHITGRAWHGCARLRWDWCSPETICWFQIVPAEFSSDGRPSITLGLTDAAPTGRIGPWLELPEARARIRLRTVRSHAPCLQGNVPLISLAESDALTGTVGALMVDARRQYSVLTCAHVIAGGENALMDTPVVLRSEQHGLGSGHLRAWLPGDPDPERIRTVDAALAAITPDQARSLVHSFPSLIPQGWVREIEIAGPLTVRTQDAPIRGEALGPWGGRVNVPGCDARPVYMEMLSYVAKPATRPGDSGAGIWDASDRLVGIHCAGTGDVATIGFNALFCPIERIANAFSARPVQSGEVISRLEPVSPEARPADESSTNVIPTDSTDEEILARTLWGEARNDSEAVMQGVASVVMNRLRRKVWWGNTLRQVCTGGGQFSCWQPRNALYPQMTSRQPPTDAAYARALDLARKALTSSLSDNTFGATHYCPIWLSTLPPWAEGKQPRETIGTYAFYNNID